MLNGAIYIKEAVCPQKPTSRLINLINWGNKKNALCLCIFEIRWTGQWRKKRAVDCSVVGLRQSKHFLQALTSLPTCFKFEDLKGSRGFDNIRIERQKLRYKERIIMFDCLVVGAVRDNLTVSFSYFLRCPRRPANWMSSTHFIDWEHSFVSIQCHESA